MFITLTQFISYYYKVVVNSRENYRQELYDL
jgi:hypothetical protein